MNAQAEVHQGAPIPVWTAAALAGLLLMALFGSTIWEVGLTCWNNDDYSHGLLLPLISGYVLYERREILGHSLRRVVPNSFSWTGLMLLGFGMLSFLLGELADLHFIRWFAFFPATFGLTALLFGNSFFLATLAPVGLLFMAKPLPDALIPKLFFPLQVFAARIAARTLDLLQVPVYLRGNVIEIPGMELMVEQACSGLRSLLALVTVASIVLLTIPMSRTKQIFLLCCSVVTAVVLNVIRVTATGLLAHFYDPATATGFFHTFSGMVVFVVGLAVVYGIAWATTTKQAQNAGA